MPRTRRSETLATQICERMVSGQSLAEICRSDDMPSRSFVNKWLSEDAEFADRYARAREALMDYWADQITAIADDGERDILLRKREDGSEYEFIDHEHINRSRLRVDTRKWLMSKLSPKKYGDKVEHTGADGGPIVVSWQPPPAE